MDDKELIDQNGYDDVHDLDLAKASIEPRDEKSEKSEFDSINELLTKEYVHKSSFEPVEDKESSKADFSNEFLKSEFSLDKFNEPLPTDDSSSKDSISELLTNDYLQKSSLEKVYEPVADNESLIADDILIQEPDSTAEAKPQKEEFLENLNDNYEDEFKNLINKMNTEEKVSFEEEQPHQHVSFKSEVETIAPIEITKSECEYCAYCKLFCYFKMRALLHAPREITSKQTNAAAAA